MSFGQRLKLLRKAAGMTQVQLAKAVGVTQGLISQYEREELTGMPSADLVYAIAKVLDGTYSYLAMQSESNEAQHPDINDPRLTDQQRKIVTNLIQSFIDQNPPPPEFLKK